jgi:hypothetical protein
MHKPTLDRMYKNIAEFTEQGVIIPSPKIPSIVHEARALTLALRNCERLGIFTSEEVDSLLSDALSLDSKHIKECRLSANIFGALYKGWDIHRYQAQNFIRLSFDENDSALRCQIYQRFIHDLLEVDTTLQRLVEKGEISAELFDEIQSITAASDRLERLLELERGEK